MSGNHEVDLAVAQRMVDLMNEAVKLDPAAVTELVNHRVDCNADLAEHPSMQAGPMESGGADVVGLLGVLNGIAGIYPSGWGAVAAVVENDGSVSGFRLLGDQGP